MAHDSSTSGDETSSDSEEESDAGGHTVGRATERATVCLEIIIKAQKEMKLADCQIKKEL
jgi:cell fate regulator YaaT (PSP1 superfamily)